MTISADSHSVIKLVQRVHTQNNTNPDHHLHHMQQDTEGMSMHATTVQKEISSWTITRKSFYLSNTMKDSLTVTSTLIHTENKLTHTHSHCSTLKQLWKACFYEKVTIAPTLASSGNSPRDFCIDLQVMLVSTVWPEGGGSLILSVAVCR